MQFLLNVAEWYLTTVIRLAWIHYVLDRFLLSMNSTNALNMVKNLTKPLYQDDSMFGRSFGFLIRSIWVSFGTIYSVITTIPFALIALIITLAPIFPLILIISFIV